VTFSERAVKRATEGRSKLVQSWFLDIGLIGAYVGSSRKYHHTAPVSMIYALHAGLARILDEGLENCWARHQAASDLLHAEMAQLGFTPFAEEGHRLAQLNTLNLPEGLDDAATRKRLLEEYNIEVGGGLGDVAGKIWRVGLMAHGAQERSVATLIGALKQVL
jgi:alanine-glyoxylate transaminase/serine-glyoxylate transaminase/serine-pyruvate transaminase